MFLGLSALLAIFQSRDPFSSDGRQVQRRDLEQCLASNLLKCPISVSVCDIPQKGIYWWVTELYSGRYPSKGEGKSRGKQRQISSQREEVIRSVGLHWVHTQLAICCTNKDATVEMGTDGPHRMNSCYYSFTTQSSLLLQFHRIITRLLRYYKFHKDVSRHNISKLGIMFT